jgi:hypothetical protein
MKESIVVQEFKIFICIEKTSAQSRTKAGEGQSQRGMKEEPISPSFKLRMRLTIELEPQQQKLLSQITRDSL